MIDCTVIGDTIALNLQNPLHCIEERAALNLTSSRIIDISNGNNVFHEVCIISAGSYDYPFSYKTYDNLNQIRNNTNCKVYVWIRPYSNMNAARDVDTIANQDGDIEVNITSSNDSVTPSSYKDLAASIVNQINAKGL